MSAIDDHKQARDRLHELEHSGHGRLRLRFERNRTQPGGYEYKEGFDCAEGEPLFKQAIALLESRLEALRLLAEKEAREFLESKP